MSTAPLVSIGVPVHNGEPYIAQALESLAGQDYPNFQVVISDNASTDGTAEVCRGYEQSDRRFRVISQARNIGGVANFRAVLDAAAGPFFMWAAADDWWDPRFVTAMVNELSAHDDAVVAMCAVDRVIEDGQLFDRIRFTGKMNPNGLSRKELLAHILSRESKFNLFIYGLFRTVPLREAMRFFPDSLSGDRMFIAQMAFAGAFRYVNEMLHVRLHRPAHVESQKRRSASWRVKLHQLYTFWRMAASSPCIGPENRRLAYWALWRWWQMVKFTKP